MATFVALAPTDLDVAEGEFLTLLGPSGSGKTTLLSLIAGLAHPDEGEVRIGGADVTYSPPYERDIGMVFQNYALFPHMTIEDNIAFPLKMRKIDAARGAPARGGGARDGAPAACRRSAIRASCPAASSSASRSRAASSTGPSIILMDEPLGALDKKLREQMQLEIKRIHRELRTTIVYVTHDQEEAMTMSDRICLMNAGRIEQLGSPDDLYFRPRSLFVADFLGEFEPFAGTVSEVAATDSVSCSRRAGAARAQRQWQRLRQRPERQGDGAPAEPRGRAMACRQRRQARRRGHRHDGQRQPDQALHGSG